jgi:DNA repair protein RadC
MDQVQDAAISTAAWRGVPSHDTEILERILAPYGGEDAARRLLGRFGDLLHVFGATFAELRQVLDEPAALDVALTGEVTRRLLAAEVRAHPLAGCWSGLHAYLVAMLGGGSRESFRVLFLDGADRLIGDELMAEGTVDHAPVYPREIMRRAIELGASGCSLVHNHPSGDPTPSSADIEMTRQVIAAGAAVGILVRDHFVVGGGAVASFRALGLV